MFHEEVPVNQTGLLAFQTYVAIVIEASMRRVGMERLSGSLVNSVSFRGEINMFLVERLLQDGVAETESGRSSFPVRGDVYVGEIFRCLKECEGDCE